MECKRAVLQGVRCLHFPPRSQGQRTYKAQDQVPHVGKGQKRSRVAADTNQGRLWDGVCLCHTWSLVNLHQVSLGQKRGNPALPLLSFLLALLVRRCDGRRFESGVIKNVSWQTSFYRVLSNWWHRARQCRLEQLGKTNGLLGAWT